jgi:hypothetical protein
MPNSGATPIRDDRRDHHLREAEAEYRAPHRPQLRQAELEPDREHQEHDAEFGELSRRGGVGHPGERVRSNRHADEQVTEDWRQPRKPAGGHHDDRAAEQYEDQLQRRRHGGP